MSQVGPPGWTLLERLEGGFQGGASIVVDGDGRRGVIKIGKTSWDAAQWEATAVLIARARSRGWPTPAWLDFGLLDEGRQSYVVTDLVAGSMPTVLTDELCSALLAVIDLQQGLEPTTIQTWATYPADVVGGEYPFRSFVWDFSVGGAGIVERIDQSCAGCDFDVGSSDLVHGDFSLDNVLVEDGVITGVVDVLAAGKGHRVVDVASLLRQCWAWHSDEPSCRRMVDAGEAMVGVEAFRVALAGRIIDVLCFGVDHWPADVDKLVSRFHGLLDFIDA